MSRELRVPGIARNFIAPPEFHYEFSIASPEFGVPGIWGEGDVLLLVLLIVLLGWADHAGIMRPYSRCRKTLFFSREAGGVMDGAVLAASERAAKPPFIRAETRRRGGALEMGAFPMGYADM